MNEILDVSSRFFSDVKPETIIQTLAAAGVLSALLLKIRKWLEIQSSGAINFINLLLSTAVVLLHGLFSAVAQNPKLVPEKALGFMALVILIYHTPFVGIKALAGLVADVKETRARKSRVADKTAAVKEVPLESVVPQVPAAVALDAPESISPVTEKDLTPVEFAAE